MTATNLASSSLCKPGSIGRSDGLPVAAAAATTVRFGVAFRLLSAFAAITIFAIATSIIALYTFGKYRNGFNRIASSSLPALVAASNLAQRSQALAANAPNLAVADGHFARRAVSEALRSQLQAIAEAGEQVKELAPGTQGLDSLIRTEASLKENLQKLDQLVAGKLEADRVAANLLLRLRVLSVRIQAAVSDMQRKWSGGDITPGQTDALSAWTAAADQAVVIMLSTSSADTTIRLNRLRAEFEEVRTRAQTSREQLSKTLIEAVEPLEQTLAQYGRGSPNIFEVRAAQLASGSAVRGTLLDTKEASARFVASAEHIFSDVQRDVRAQSDFFAGLISEYSRLFIILSLLGVAGACGVFFYINRSIIRRLEKLSQSMRASVYGHSAAISISGNDEIADMAKAADFFITSIAQREKGLHESLRQQTATADVLKVISRSTFDLRAVLEALIESATRLCGATRGHIFKFDGELLRFAAAYGASPMFIDALKNHPTRPGPGSISGQAASERRTVHCHDVLLKADYEYSDLVEKQGYRTVLAVPMLRESSLLGVITILKTTVNPFTDKQIELVTTFADQAVIAIENVRLFEEVQARTRELAQSVEELHALGEVTQAVNSTVDLETVLTTIVAKATQLSGTEAGAIYVFDEAEQKFRLQATFGLDDTTVAELRDSHIRIGETAISEAVERRMPIQVPDIQSDPSATIDVIIRAGFRALLIVPLLATERIIGALVIRRKQPGEFRKTTVELLQTFAAQSVMAIQNARLFSEIEKKSVELETASKHKSQFLANMSHELRTPLNAIIGVTEMLREDAEALKQDVEPLDRVLGASRHLLALINDILDLSKIEAGRMELHLESFSLPPLIDSVVKTVEPLTAKNANEVVVRCEAAIGTMRADQMRLRQALLNLLSNANKFTESGTITIDAHQGQENKQDWITLAVTDTGIGMTAEQMGNLFQEFAQASSATASKYGGTGLGLAISKRFCQMMGGDIAVKSEPGRGATFTIRVPRIVQVPREATALNPAV
jgi:signal transduction histidine kinase